MNVRTRPMSVKSAESSTQLCCCGIHPTTCLFALAICLLLLTVVNIGLLIVSHFWWGFVGVGLGLLTALCLLAANLTRKSPLYFVSMALCILTFLAVLALAIYAFLIGLNQLGAAQLSEQDRFLMSVDEGPSNSTTTTERPIDVSSERIRGIFNMTFTLVSALILALLIAAFIAAFLDMKCAKKSQQVASPERYHMSAFNVGATKNAPSRARVVEEDVEIIEERIDTALQSPYY